MSVGNEGVQYSRLKGDRKVRTLAASQQDLHLFPESLHVPPLFRLFRAHRARRRLRRAVLC
ncbi:hypothetical protein, partial [Achromobacter xylosoxidans]|uniref:hypothetical protein n=1 Tax=Alcaligenes xylosoxydans xylosoxydans TaxID=85698 RepID=UPI001F13F4CD